MWTLEELVGRVARALAAGDVRAPNGRVTEVPDRRVIRWYATIGLVDRPLGVRGRTALYGPRHLLQLVAVKRRQAEGLPLAEIQAELAGATDATLTRIAAVPPDLLEDGPALDGPRERRFWARPPVSADPGATVGASRVEAAATRADGGSGVLHGVRIGPAVLLIPSTVDREDVAAIQAAARPLLDLLAARGLLPSPEGGTE